MFHQSPSDPSSAHTSPRPEEEPPAEPRPVPCPFGLERPIHAAGTLSRQHVEEAVRMMSSTPSAARSCFAGGILSALLAGYLCLDLGPANPAFLAAATFAAWICALGLLDWLGRRQSKRALLETHTGAGAKLELVLDEDGISSCSPAATTFVGWPVLTKCVYSPSLVVFDGHFLVPRSFFASPDDWDLFVRLTRHKLPDDKRVPPPVSDIPPAAATIGAAQAAIRGRGVVRFGDARRVQRCLPGYWQSRGRLAVQFAPFALVPVPTVVSAIVTGVHGPAQFIPGAVGVAVVGWMLFIVLRQIAVARDDDDVLTACALATSEDELAIETPSSRATLRWDHFGAFQRCDNLLLLYPQGGRGVDIICASFFTEADWQRLLQLVARKVPARRHHRGWGHS